MRSNRMVVALALAAFAAGCASGPATKPVAEWRDPAVTQPLKKVAVGVATKDPAKRRIVEDQIVAKLPPGTAIASYTFIPSGSEREVEVVRKLVAEQGADGALVVRVMSVEQNEVVTPGAPVPVSTYGYWGYAYTTAYTPTTVEVETTVYVDSKLYAIDTNKLVWSMETETRDPESAAQVRAEVADLVTRRMLAQKVIAAPAPAPAPTSAPAPAPAPATPPASGSPAPSPAQ